MVNEMLHHVGKAGLREIIPGCSEGFTDAGEWADKIYKGRPVYFSMEKNRYLATKGVQEYEIDISVVDTEKLRADLPSLVDSGMYITEDGKGWWEEGQEPVALKPYLKNGEISLIKLSKLWQPAKSVTGTLAYLGNIYVLNPNSSDAIQ